MTRRSRSGSKRSVERRLSALETDETDDTPATLAEAVKKAVQRQGDGRP